MSEHTERATALRTLRELIKDIRIGMLTTALPDGTLRSRPMATQEGEWDQHLWFFTRADAAKTAEIHAHPHVNLSYAAPRENRYVSVSGTATLVRDRQRIEQLWDQLYAAWFPQGLNDPELALLRVEVERAEYWDAPSSTMVEIAGFIPDLTDRPGYPLGEHAQVDFGLQEQA